MTLPGDAESVSSINEYGEKVEDPELSTDDIEAEENAAYEAEQEFEQAQEDLWDEGDDDEGEVELSPPQPENYEEGEADSLYQSDLNSYLEEAGKSGETQDFFDAQVGVADEMGYLTTSRPEGQRLIKEAQRYLDRAAEADMRGEYKKAAEMRQVAAMYKKDIDREFAKETPIQARARSKVYRDNENVLRNVRDTDMTEEEYNENAPKGAQGFRQDLQQIMDAQNRRSDTDVVYVIEGHSALDSNLVKIDQDRPVDGSHLRKIKLPEWTNPREVTQAARDSNSSLLDYLCQTGLIETRPQPSEEQESDEDNLHDGLSNAEYREARGLTQKPYENFLYKPKSN